MKMSAMAFPRDGEIDSMYKPVKVVVMTLAAMLLSRRVYVADISTRARYALLGTLFVNISIGGVLTPFAATSVRLVPTTKRRSPMRSPPRGSR